MLGGGNDPDQSRFTVAKQGVMSDTCFFASWGMNIFCISLKGGTGHSFME